LNSIDARLNSVDVLETNCIFNVLPLQDNVHELLGVEDSLVLDVLLPNYDDQERICNNFLLLTPRQALTPGGSVVLGYPKGYPPTTPSLEPSPKRPMGNENEPRNVQNQPLTASNVEKKASPGLLGPAQ
jgi:hypothetical protein